MVVRNADAVTDAAIRDGIRGVDSDLRVYGMKPMSVRIALRLAMVGVYGLVAYMVNQGGRDIGIRIALGATGRMIRLMILNQGMRIAVPGLLCGALGALAATRLMQTHLFGIGASDPLTVVSVLFLLIGVSAAACYIPRRRASGIDPIVFLRSDD